MKCCSENSSLFNILVKWSKRHLSPTFLSIDNGAYQFSYIQLNGRNEYATSSSVRNKDIKEPVHKISRGLKEGSGPVSGSGLRHDIFAPAVGLLKIIR